MWWLTTSCFCHVCFRLQGTCAISLQRDGSWRQNCYPTRLAASAREIVGFLFCNWGAGPPGVVVSCETCWSLVLWEVWHAPPRVHAHTCLYFCLPLFVFTWFQWWLQFGHVHSCLRIVTSFHLCHPESRGKHKSRSVHVVQSISEVHKSRSITDYTIVSIVSVTVTSN